MVIDMQSVSLMSIQNIDAVVKPMKFKSEGLEKLKQYVGEEGVPEKFRSDNAKKI